MRGNTLIIKTGRGRGSQKNVLVLRFLYSARSSFR